MTFPMKIINLILAVSLLFSLFSHGQDFPPRPNQLVNDYADLLSQQEEQALERKLSNYYDTTSTEIAIAIISSVGGYDAMDYAIRLGEHWGVGGGENDNGALILIAKNERKLAIATGYGLEGAIPDAATLQIRQEYMNPYFKNGDFYTGLEKGTDIMISLAEGEYTADNIPGTKTAAPVGFIFALFFFGLIILIATLSNKVNRARRRSYGKRNVDFWTAFMLGSMLGGGGHSSGSSWSDFSQGGGSFGGGGGFGGFGGGSFGGGGSAGSW